MKPRVLFVLLGIICATAASAQQPAAPVVAVAPAVPVTPQPVLVSVHGAWAGGWQMKKVAPILEAHGWKVYRPSASPRTSTTS
jgi:hypothetical protein